MHAQKLINHPQTAVHPEIIQKQTISYSAIAFSYQERNPDLAINILQFKQFPTLPSSCNQQSNPNLAIFNSALWVNLQKNLCYNSRRNAIRADELNVHVKCKK